ncbi:hypothetical protein HWI79_3168 [Cryptosporidium felis]|nr:hypothetical protein HWI79_3168 [Cryptosporidium felis]
MNNFDLSLISSKFISLGEKGQVGNMKEIARPEVAKKAASFGNKATFPTLLSQCMDDLENDAKILNGKKSSQYVKLVGEFLNSVKNELLVWELRLKKEDSRPLMDELICGMEESLIITSNLVFQVSGNSVFRSLISREFPDILGLLISIASSELIEIKLRCRFLEAALELMKHASEDLVSESIQLRKCLLEGQNKVLSRLWKSIYQCEKLYSPCIFDLRKEFEVHSPSDKFTEDEPVVFVTLVLEIFSNILHFQRYLTEKILLKLSIEAICVHLDTLLNLSVSSLPRIYFLSGIILRSLLLDSNEDQYRNISKLVKSNGIILVYLIRVIYFGKGCVEKIPNPTFDHSMLFAQIISILSQNDPEIFNFILKIFPTKFFIVFNNKWFNNGKFLFGNQLNMLPWFPINCSWYNMKTNILATDSISFDLGMKKFATLKEKMIRKHISKLEDILEYGNSLTNHIYLGYNDSVIKRVFSFSKEAITQSALFIKNQIYQYENNYLKSGQELTIRRYPDFTWYLFWELCYCDYQDQLDLIWDRTVKIEIVEILIQEFSRLKTEQVSNSGWKFEYFFPEIPKIANEVQISESVYLRLLIPTLSKIHQVSGLFHLEYGSNSNLMLESQKIVRIGNLKGYMYKFNVERGKFQSESNSQEFSENDDFLGFIDQLRLYFGYFKNNLRSYFNKNGAISNYSHHFHQEDTLNKIKESASIRDLVINTFHQEDWEFLSKEPSNSHQPEILTKLNEKLLQTFLSSKIPYIECIENVDKIRLIFDHLFQKVISETNAILKIYMLYGYAYYIIVFNEYIPGQQIAAHLQNIFTLYSSSQEKVLGTLLVYILHIILTLYEEVRMEFFKIGGFILVNDFINIYQKNWSVTKQLNIYNDEKIIEEINRDIGDEKMDPEKYTKIFIKREAQITNYKVFGDAQKEELIFSEANVIKDSLPGIQQNLETEVEIFILDIPEVNEFIRDGMTSKVVERMISAKTNQKDLKGLSHRQYMNIWSMIINEDQLRISIKDYFGSNKGLPLEKIISEIPSEMNSEDCLNSKGSGTPESHPEEGTHSLFLRDKNLEAEVKSLGPGLFSSRMCNYDMISYRELITWLVTLNNCILQSKFWISKLLKSSFIDIIKLLLGLLLRKNKIREFEGEEYMDLSIEVEKEINVGLMSNFHIYWASKILVNILKQDSSLVLKMVDNYIIEILLMLILRFDPDENKNGFELVRDEIINLFRNCILELNSLDMEIVIKRECLAKNRNNKDNNTQNLIHHYHLKDCGRCNAINGCVFGDTICFLLSITRKMGVKSNIEIEELRMIELFGYGVYCASKYLPISILQLLGLHKVEFQDDDQSGHFIVHPGIQLFKEAVLNLNIREVDGIRFKWNEFDRIKLLIQLSQSLFIHGLKMDCDFEDQRKSLVTLNQDYIPEIQDLNIYGYYLNSLNKVVGEMKILEFDSRIKLLNNIADNSSDQTIINEWINISKQICSERLISILENSGDNRFNGEMTIIFKKMFMESLNENLDSSCSIRVPNRKKSYHIFRNIWNVLQYYLYLLIKYLVDYKKEENISLNVKSILNLQFNILTMGIHYLKDHETVIKIIGEKDLLYFGDSLDNPEDGMVFNQLIDQYYRIICNNIKENVMIFYNLEVSNIIGKHYLDAKNGLKSDLMLEIFNINLRILSLITEFYWFKDGRLNSKFYNFGKIREYESILLEEQLLLKEKISDSDENNDFNNSSEYLILERNTKTNLILDLLLLKNGEKNEIVETVNLILNKLKKMVIGGIKDKTIFSILVNYFSKRNLIGSKVLLKDILVLDIIKEYIRNDLEYKCIGIEMGILSKLINQILENSRGNDESDNKLIKTLMFETLSIIYKEKNQEIRNIFESLLTPALCKMLEIKIEGPKEEKNEYLENCQSFIVLINLQVVTPHLIWTKGMHDQLLEWSRKESKFKFISNDLSPNPTESQYNIVLEENNPVMSFRERYYKVVNNELGIKGNYESSENDKNLYDGPYDFLREEYIFGIYKLYYVLLSWKVRTIGKIRDIKWRVEVDLRRLIDIICGSLEKDYNILFLYKLLVDYGTRDCFIGDSGDHQIERNIKMIVDYVIKGGKNHCEQIIEYLKKEKNEFEIENGKEIANYDDNMKINYLWKVTDLIVERLLIYEGKVERDSIKIILTSQINRMLIFLIIYIQEKYLLRKELRGEELIWGNSGNNNCCGNSQEEVVLLKLLRGLNPKIINGNKSCEAYMSKLIINLMILIFKYGLEMKLEGGDCHKKNREDVVTCFRKEIMLKFITLMRQIVIGQNSLERKKYEEIFEFMVFPLNKYITKKITRLLLDEKEKNLNSIQTKMILNKDKNIIEIMIEKESSVEFLDWFISDHNEINLKWNIQTIEKVLLNMTNTKGRIVKMENKRSEIGVDKPIELEMIKKLAKYEYYKAFVNGNTRIEAESGTEKIIKGAQENFKNYLLKLILVREINYLTDSLITLLIDNNEEKKKLEKELIIKKILIVKFGELEEIIKFDEYSSGNFASHEIYRDEFRRNENSNSIITNRRLLKRSGKITSDEKGIFSLGNLHPCFKVYGELDDYPGGREIQKTVQKRDPQLRDQDQSTEIQSLELEAFYKDLIYNMILVKDMMKILVKSDLICLEKHGRKLFVVVDEILKKIIVSWFSNQYSNNQIIGFKIGVGFGFLDEIVKDQGQFVHGEAVTSILAGKIIEDSSVKQETSKLKKIMEELLREYEKKQGKRGKTMVLSKTYSLSLLLFKRYFKDFSGELFRSEYAGVQREIENERSIQGENFIFSEKKENFWREVSPDNEVSKTKQDCIVETIAFESEGVKDEDQYEEYYNYEYYEDPISKAKLIWD